MKAPANGWRERLDLAVFVTVAALAGMLYCWLAQAAGHRFVWGADHGGYYNYLGRAFAAGRLYLPIEPSPRLLALPNPYDPAVPDELKMHDMALYRGRYYLYHGATPALIAFAPWKLATGHDLPENFALFLFCFGGFLFAAGTLRRVLALAGVRPSPWLTALLLLPLAAGNGIPYLLNRVWVYEVAIGAGWLCVSGGLYFFARAAGSPRAPAWLAASGAMLGLAIGCRPHLGFVAAALFVALLWICARDRGLWAALNSREAAAFTLPIALGGAAAAAYNFYRFGSPFEFGTTYLLSGPHQNRVRLAAANLLPGLYYFLFCAPRFGAVFPWAEIAFRYPFDSVAYGFPPEYFIEKITGAIYLAPLLPLAALAAPADKGARALLRAMAAAAGAVLVFLAATGFTTQRYMADFLPMATLAATANAGVWLGRARPAWKIVGMGAAAVLTAAGIVVNLAIGVSGPFDEMLKERPRSYVRLAKLFRPAERHRPLLDPGVSVSFTAEPRFQLDGFREPLFSMGHAALRYGLNLDHSSVGLQLVSRTEASTERRNLGRPEGPLRFNILYLPETASVTVAMDGREIVKHRLGTLVTAPSEIHIGEAPEDGWLTVRKFTGKITGSTWNVSAAR